MTEINDEPMFEAIMEAKRFQEQHKTIIEKQERVNINGATKTMHRVYRDNELICEFVVDDDGSMYTPKTNVQNQKPMNKAKVFSIGEKMSPDEIEEMVELRQSWDGYRSGDRRKLEYPTLEIEEKIAIVHPREKIRLTHRSVIFDNQIPFNTNKIPMPSVQPITTAENKWHDTRRSSYFDSDNNFYTTY